MGRQKTAAGTESWRGEVSGEESSTTSRETPEKCSGRQHSSWAGSGWASDSERLGEDMGRQKTAAGTELWRGGDLW
jgi:hypothetical protein